jgi:hypothetical protein
MIVGNMATFPARNAGIREAVDRVYGQVDRLNLCLNEYHEVPAWMAAYAKLNPVIPETDLKDVGKFMFPCDPNDTVFLLDDDLCYPSNYVSRSTIAVELAKEINSSRMIFGYHGTNYRRPTAREFLRWKIDDFKAGKKRYRLLKKTFLYYSELSDFTIVGQIGTGTALLEGRDMPPYEFMKGSEKRVDVRFAKWSFFNGIKMVCLERQEGFIPRGGDDDVSIYRTYTVKMPKEIAGEVVEFGYKIRDAGKTLREISSIAPDRGKWTALVM